MTDFVWIDRESTFQNLIKQLQDKPYVAVDTESNSLYNYYEKVCLVQLSTDTDDYIVDPLAIDITPLETILSNPDIEKIFHAAEYDILSLRRDYGFQIHGLFDTMIAARILGWPKYGLGNILRARFKIKPNKHFQQYNWGQRPLSQAALEYANLDTYYLAKLRDIQYEELAGQKRVEEAKAAFERVTLSRADVKIFNPADFWFIKGTKELQPNQLSLLQDLYVFRDQTARTRNRPPFKILTDSAMLTIAKVQPSSFKELKQLKGLNASFLRRYRREITTILQGPRHNPLPYPKNNHTKPSDSMLQRYEHLRSWRNTTAKTRGVEPDVILQNDVLMAVAKANPKDCDKLKEAHILGDWQFKTYASDIIRELEKL